MVTNKGIERDALLSYYVRPLRESPPSNNGILARRRGVSKSVFFLSCVFLFENAGSFHSHLGSTYSDAVLGYSFDPTSRPILRLRKLTQYFEDYVRQLSSVSSVAQPTPSCFSQSLLKPFTLCPMLFSLRPSPPHQSKTSPSSLSTPKSG